MNKTIIILPAVTLAAPRFAQAQSTTTYLSNLGQSSTGALAVGSDSWVAAGFSTGTNAAGYSLDSIQLAMTDAAGSPSGFTVMVYANIVPPTGSAPGQSLGTLNGSLDPATSGVYTYIPASSLTLSPRTPYFIVLTSGTAVAGGAYEWSFADVNSYSSSDGWQSLGRASTSSNGLFPWRYGVGAYPQFGINATGLLIPEPSTLALLGLGGVVPFWRRRKGKAI